MDVLKFMQDTYTKTQFPFFTVMGLKLAFGATTVNDLNELRKQGYIRRRNGANGPLVELLVEK